MATLKVTNIKNESFAGDQLYLKSDGRIGIGTTSPDSNLDIEGSGSPELRVTDTTNTVGAYIQSNDTKAIFGSRTNHPVQLEQNAGAALFIDTSKNVGIGTTNPDTKLEINGGADAIAKVTGTTTAARLDLKTNSHHRFIQTLESDGALRVYDQTNASERLRVTSGGRILIATTTEGHSNADDLTIATAAGSLGNTGITIRSSTTGDGNIFFSDATSGDGETKGVIKYSHNGDSLKFNTAGQQRLEIDSDGDIEVGGNLKTNNLPGRNLIINGAFQIAQRATTNDTAGAQSTYHTLDRWLTQIQAGTITESQQSLSASDTGPWQKGLRHYMRILNNGPIGAGAAQYAEIDQRIEAQTIAQSGWDYTDSAKYITLSFWLRASVAQSYIVVLYANDGTQRHYPFEVALSANTWTKVTKAIPGNSGITINNDNGHGATVNFIAMYGTNYTSNSGGSFNTWNTTGNGLERWPDMTTTWATTANATFDVTGVQLEVGSIATEFEHRSYGEELARCQRYFYRSSGNKIVIFNSYNSATDNFWAEMYLPTTMRAAPTTTITSIGAGSVSSTTMSIDQLSFQSTSGATHFNNSTIIEASAEL